MIETMEFKWNLFAEEGVIIVFGYSRLGKRFCDNLLRKNYKAIYFCDNSINKIGEIYKGIPVLSVEQAISVDGIKFFVICSLFHEHSMKEQLLYLNVGIETIFSPPEELIEIEKSQMRTDKISSKSKLQFEVDIAMHCNLKCRSCHHFSPLAEKETTDIHVFQKDFERLKSLFNEEVDRIYLLGGEPLLNENICSYMEIARKNFHTANIELVTNGLLISKKQQDFWDCCIRNEIKIAVTKYPINVNYKKIEELCKEHNAKFEFFGSAIDNKHMSHYPLDLEGKFVLGESKCIE